MASAMQQMLLGMRVTGGGGPSPGVNAAAFLARTSGLDTTHTNAYIDFINGLDTDGLFSKFDFLHIYATQNSTTALLNLVSTNFNGTSNGSPTFTADRGFTGTDASATKYIDTGFNPTTASSPQFVQNSAHLSAWNLTASNNANPIIGSVGSGGNNQNNIYPQYTDNITYCRINGSNHGGTFNAISPTGHYIGNRSSSSAMQSYRNGSALTPQTNTSQAPLNGNFYTIASNNNGTPSGCGLQMAAASGGSSLNSTEAGNFYSRLRTYMTAVGVP